MITVVHVTMNTFIYTIFLQYDIYFKKVYSGGKFKLSITAHQCLTKTYRMKERRLYTMNGNSKH